MEWVSQRSPVLCFQSVGILLTVAHQLRSRLDIQLVYSCGRRATLEDEASEPSEGRKRAYMYTFQVERLFIPIPAHLLDRQRFKREAV